MGNGELPVDPHWLWVSRSDIDDSDRHGTVQFATDWTVNEHLSATTQGLYS